MSTETILYLALLFCAGYALGRFISEKKYYYVRYKNELYERTIHRGRQLFLNSYPNSKEWPMTTELIKWLAEKVYEAEKNEHPSSRY